VAKNRLVETSIVGQQDQRWRLMISGLFFCVNSNSKTNYKSPTPIVNQQDQWLLKFFRQL
jgi:hypothetical protein